MNENKDKGFIRFVPNALTIARLVMTVIFLGMIIHAGGKEEIPSTFLLIAFIFFVITGLTDIVDGKVARMYDVTSKFGRIADPLADKFLVCGAFICFAIVDQPGLASFGFSDLMLDVFRWATVVIIIAREVSVTIIRHIAESKGINFAATVSGKAKMFLQTFGIGTIMVAWAYITRPWADWFILVTYLLMLGATVFSGIRSVRRSIK